MQAIPVEPAEVQDSWQPEEHENPEVNCHKFEESLREFQTQICDDPKVDLLADYEEAKQDYMCPVELRKLDMMETTT